MHDLEELFQASKGEASLQSLMRYPCARQRMECPEDNMRGLERCGGWNVSCMLLWANIDSSIVEACWPFKMPVQFKIIVSFGNSY
jgi:hypothetical protein